MFWAVFFVWVWMKEWNIVIVSQAKVVQSIGGVWDTVNEEANDWIIFVFGYLVYEL